MTLIASVPIAPYQRALKYNDDGVTESEGADKLSQSVTGINVFRNSLRYKAKMVR